MDLAESVTLPTNTTVSEITPLWTSGYSHASGSLLTLEEPGKTKSGEPQSIFDLATSASLKEVVLVEERASSFINAYKSASKAGVKLCYGLKVVVCSDASDKTPQSRATESKLVVFALNTQGYHDLVRIGSRAWTTGHFTGRRGGGLDESYGRTDWTTLRSLWTPNLAAALPFFSSFLAINTLTMNRVVPDLATLSSYRPIQVFREVGSQLPFSPLIDHSIDRYLADVADPARAVEVLVKTVYYARRSDFTAYQIRRAQYNRTTIDEPEVAHLASAEFCLESWREAVGS